MVRAPAQDEVWDAVRAEAEWAGRLQQDRAENVYARNAALQSHILPESLARPKAVPGVEQK
jgi:hypothetical protein